MPRFPIYLSVILLLSSTPFDALAQAENNDFGYLNIRYNIDSLFIELNDELIAIQSGDSISLPAGRQNLLLVSPFHRDWRRTFAIDKDKTTWYEFYFHEGSKHPNLNYHPESSYFNHKTPPSRITVITDHNSEIFLNGKFMGRERINLEVESGVYRIETRNPDAGNKTKKTTIFGFEEHQMFNYPKRYKARLLATIPGASQYYKNQPAKAIVLAGTILSSLGISAYKNHQYQMIKSDYHSTVAEYSWTTDPDKIVILTNKAESEFSEMKQLANSRNLWFYVASGLYIVNLIDAFAIMPQGGYRNVSLHNGLDSHSGKLTMGFNIAF